MCASLSTMTSGCWRFVFTRSVPHAVRQLLSTTVFFHSAVTAPGVEQARASAARAGVWVVVVRLVLM
eukprot:973483-Alexandrium_andersonii.AAC.1